MLAACSLTVEPPAGAEVASCTVQTSVPADVGSGLQVRLVTVPGVFVSDTFAVCEAPARPAVITAVWLEVKLPAVAVNVAVLAPATTVTVGGTLRVAVLLPMLTTVPLLGAAWVKVTVQVVVPPELTDDGVHDTELSPAPAMMDRDDVCEAPLRLTEMLAD